MLGSSFVGMKCSVANDSGEGARSRLPDSDIDEILEVMKAPLRSGQPGEAIEAAIELMGRKLDRTEDQARLEHEEARRCSTL